MLNASIDDDGVLQVEINIGNLKIPEDVDLTARQVLKIVSVAIRKTLIDYNSMQKDEMKVILRIVGTNESNNGLQDLGMKYLVPGKGE
jgi:hypothetical protein